VRGIISPPPLSSPLKGEEMNGAKSFLEGGRCIKESAGRPVKKSITYNVEIQ